MDAAPNNNAYQSQTLAVADEQLILLRDGALWWGKREMLIVSDLHFEKGSSYAAHGQMIPPYDTAVTLSKIERLMAEYSPKICLSLGDSFHDGAAEARLGDAARGRIKALTSSTDWIWVEGNHDPVPPAALGGRAETVLRLDGLVFRHEPTGEVGEIAGHLHPVAKVSAHGRSVRKKCFITDGSRLIMPALGSLTGGLNVLDDAFFALFADRFTAYALGADRVYPLASKRLAADRSARS